MSETERGDAKRGQYGEEEMRRGGNEEKMREKRERV